MLRYIFLMLFVIAAPVIATGPNEITQSSAQKLIGSWEGQGGCDGNLVIRADKTFELKGYGPGGDTLSGVWVVEVVGLSRTLVLKDKTPGTFYDTLRFPIRRNDDKNLHLNRVENGPSGEYMRVRK